MGIERDALAMVSDEEDEVLGRELGDCAIA
jgi:hypothetical protein